MLFPPTHHAGGDVHLYSLPAWVDIHPSPGNDQTAFAARLVFLTAFVVLLGKECIFVWWKKGMPVVKILSVVLPARK